VAAAAPRAYGRYADLRIRTESGSPKLAVALQGNRRRDSGLDDRRSRAMDEAAHERDPRPEPPDGPTPRVSIGMPVYNGANFLAETLDSLLAQRFTDFELIISDNGSSDDTERICRAYADRDRRVRYFREAVNRGATWNHNRVIELATGEYFKLAAHDDLCLPDFLGRCVAVLDSSPDVVLCHPRVAIIDAAGERLQPYRYAWTAGSPRVRERLHALSGLRYRCFPVFGVVRTDALRRTRLMGPYIASDRVMLAELGLRGRFAEVGEELFLSREHQGRSTRAHKVRSGRTAWFDPNRRVRVVLPVWRQGAEFVRAIRRAPLAPGERAACYAEMVRWVGRHYKSLGKDVVLAVPQAVRAARAAVTSDRGTRPASGQTA
jgi:glycosyltransferase involved in cell wall biosynthesis